MEVQKLGYTVKESAAMSGVSSKTIERAAAAGALKVTRFGRRVIVPVAELERFVRDGWDGSEAK